MRVVFLGFQTWGHRVLDALLKSRHEVLLVVTHPSSGHPYEAIWDESVGDLARDHGVPWLVRKSLDDDEVRQRIAGLRPDIIVSSDWRTWVSPRIYSKARYGAINVHDALLPRYGGFAPLNWALVNGETEVGVTVHFMNEEFDLGDIVLQERVPVEPTDTATDLFHRTLELFPCMTLEALDLIGSGTGTWLPQDPAQATFFHKRSLEDSRIDWNLPARDIVNLVRAQADPYPNAFGHYAGRQLRILEAAVSLKRYGGTPGRVFCREAGGVAVVCGPGARSGREHGIVLKLVRTDEDRTLPASGFFTAMGGYLS
jgi:methionyl-tRNA formyltransferase